MGEGRGRGNGVGGGAKREGGLGKGYPVLGRLRGVVSAGLVVLAVVAGLLGAFAVWALVRSGPREGRAGSEAPPGRPLPTRDGTWVASKGEQRIANWLSGRGIAYTYEPELAGGLTPDFHLEGTRVVIEYWGLASEPSYEARMLEKIAQYEDHGYEVVSLFPAHLHELEDVLERELAELGVP